MHHLGSSFEQSPTAAGKQGVTAEQQVLGGAVERNMIERVSGYRNDPKLSVQYRDQRVVADGLFDAIDVGIVGSDNPATGVLSQCLQTANMIEVVVCDQNPCQCQRALLEMVENGLRITRVDHPGGHAVIDHPDIVVVEGRYRLEIHDSDLLKTDGGQVMVTT